MQLVLERLEKPIKIRIVPDLTQIRPEPDLAGFRNSNPAGSRFGEWRQTRLLDHRTIHLVKLMVSAVLSAAVKRQYSSVLPLLRHCLAIFGKICGMTLNFVQGCHASWKVLDYFFKIPGPGESWKITLVLEIPGKISLQIMH